MIGLIIKDLLTLKKQGRILFLLAGFYFVLAYASNNIGMFGTISAVLSLMLPITAMAYDERSQWDRYAVSMPISRTKIVLSKYVLGIVLNLTVSLLVCIGNVVLASTSELYSYGEMMATTLGISVGALVLLAFLLPLLFKFGVEKGRLLLMLIFLVPTFLIIFLSNTNKGIESINMQQLDQYWLLLPVIIIGILLTSIFLSIRIYQHKQF